MSSDHTQHQDDDQQSQSKELSRQRSRPPIEVEGYDARQFLGAGAYGEVWVALDTNTGRKVAIKFYTQKSGVDWSQLAREVEKLVFLSADRYVVQLLDVGWDSDPPYYVMEFVDGGSLQQLLEREGPLPVGETVEMFREIVTGLLHAHGKGVLHCDLKPANILLDQDRKPRLADFGQSRLSHEQTPALGTLFFMAPEQADLNAVPDARWDVYALGALLYCMLTGEAPYRTEALLSEIDSSPSLIERLAAYRNEINNSPPPTKHRQIVDRELGDIVDRCLAVDPANRYPNVQSVLTALRARDAAKDRKPLLLLGLLGPLLFLGVLAVFGSTAYRTSVRQSGNILRTWAHESCQFTAKFVAQAVARRIDDYFDLVEAEANDPALQEIVKQLQKDPEIATMLTKLTTDGDEGLRQRFVTSPLRAELDRRMGQLIAAHEGSVASWFVTDARGVQLASAIPNEESSTVGRDYSRRAYFHGLGEDYKSGKHYDLTPLSNTKLSPVFQSEASGTWKVAVSTPIRQGDTTIGVVALTVELGQLGTDAGLSASDGRFVVIVDGRKEHRGQILQHPLFNDILEKHPRLDDTLSGYTVPLDKIPLARSASRREEDGEQSPFELYTDPLGVPAVEILGEAGSVYGGLWIAAQEPVKLDGANSKTAKENKENRLIVLVQEDYDNAAAPIEKLGRGVLRDALNALLLLLAGVLYLWYLASRAWRDPNEATRRTGGSSVRASSLNSMETLELPENLRRSGFAERKSP